MWFIRKANVYKQDSLNCFTNLLIFLAQIEKGFTKKLLHQSCFSGSFMKLSY